MDKVIYLILALIFVVITYKLLEIIYNLTFRESFKQSKLSIKDEKFLHKCFNKESMESFKKYYGDININKITKNNKTIAMCFDTDNNIISESPFITLNGVFFSHLCVDEKERNQGLGTKLLNKIINKAKATGKDHVILLVKQSNKKAIKLYEKNGFRIYQKGNLEDGTPAIYYVKYL